MGFQEKSILINSQVIFKKYSKLISLWTKQLHYFENLWIQKRFHDICGSINHQNGVISGTQNHHKETGSWAMNLQNGPSIFIEQEIINIVQVMAT